MSKEREEKNTKKIRMAKQKKIRMAKQKKIRVAKQISLIDVQSLKVHRRGRCYDIAFDRIAKCN